MKKFNKTVLAFLFTFIFSFIGGTTLFAAGAEKVDLGSSGAFTVLSKTGISTTGSTSIVGDIAVSPAAATFITGFALTLPAGSSFSTSALVTGKVYAPGYANPTPSNLTTAVLDMQTAYTEALGRAPGFTELGAGNIGGLTLAPGVYKWGTGVTIPTDVTLSGNATDVWIFQIAQNLDISSATKIVLAGGAKASNIFWVVAGQTTIGTTAVFNGNILDQTAIVLKTGSVLNGKALAQTAVTLDSNVVTSAATYVFPNIGSTSVSGGSSPMPIVISGVVTIPSGSSSVPVTDPLMYIQSETGCSNGNLYNTTNGHLCNKSTPEVGCSVGNLFSTVNGHPCNGGLELGCSSQNKYNTSTGKLCNNYIVNTTKYNFGINTLSLFSKGEEVSELQKFLNKSSNLSLVVDGVFGSKTSAAVKKWQQENNLVADGLVGVETKARMNA